MATNYTDRLTKLGNKLDVLTVVISEKQYQREQIISEIQSLVSDTASPKAPTTAVRRGATSLGDKIMSLLVMPSFSADGLTVQDIANRLKVTASKVGVSIYHLVQKNLVYKNSEGAYYAAEREPITASPKEVVSE